MANIKLFDVADARVSVKDKGLALSVEIPGPPKDRDGPSRENVTVAFPDDTRHDFEAEFAIQSYAATTGWGGQARHTPRKYFLEVTLLGVNRDSIPAGSAVFGSQKAANLRFGGQ